MKGRFFLIFLIGLVLFGMIRALPVSGQDRERIEEGRITGRLETPYGSVTWSMGPRRVDFLGDSGAEIFHLEETDPGTLALGCGYAPGPGLHAFFQRVDPDTNIRHLRIVSQHQPPVDQISWPGAIYSPVLATDHGNRVFAVTEDFEIVAWDLESGVLQWRKKFDAPVLNPRLVRIANREALVFDYFRDGSYRKHYMFTGPAFPPETIYDSAPESPQPETPVPDSSEPDPRIILAFGDSITYGYVDKAEAPELGYVPRLQELFDVDFEGIRVLNAGIPGENTFAAIERYNQVLQDTHAAFLLFHEGINDSIMHWRNPVSSTIFNIRVIMERALELNIQPVLSTIIPRDPSHWTGFGIHRLRAEGIRDGIRVIAAELNLPLIDFWTIFENYPQSDGGYLSLMSDYVHPSEKGYQIMAQQWHETLLAIPPKAPQNVFLANARPWRLVLNWNPNREFDLEEYVVRYGDSPQNLTLEAVTSRPEFTLLRPPFQTELQRHRWVQVFARDNGGHTGAGSEIIRVEFPLSTGSSNQKQIPTLKRMPLKRDDKTEILR